MVIKGICSLFCCSLLLAVLFTACETDPKNDEPFKQGSLFGKCYDNGTCDEGLVCKDDICWEIADNDLVTDDLIPDKEKVDLDTTDLDTTDLDTTDTDGADADDIITDAVLTDDILSDDSLLTDDVVTDDITDIVLTDDIVTDNISDDDDIIAGPCDPNPCLNIADSDGVCTVDGETFVCGCDANYTWNPLNTSCAADTRRTDCINIPDNAHGIGDNGDGKFEQTWDGDVWLPGSVICTWECDTNYTWDAGATTCKADIRRTDCANIPLNAHGIGDNADGKFAQTWDGSVWLPASVVCTWSCDTNYTVNLGGDACIPDTRRTDCTNIPANAHGTGDNDDGKFEQIWDSERWLPVSVVCTWECNDNFSLNAEETGCVANTQRIDCANIPENAHGTGDNDDGKFEQIWDGDSWEPASFACSWTCDAGYLLNAAEDGCESLSVIYVDLNASGNNNGSSWEHAFTELSAAITFAVTGQEIWVAAGTYHPTQCPTTETCEPRQPHFTLKSGVAIYGGFTGIETARDDRDAETNETILSGDLGDDDLWDGTAWSNREENAVHVFIVDDAADAPSALLDGFTITAGQADDAENNETDGGGMKLTAGAAPTIRNCRFVDNSAAGSGGSFFIYEAIPTIQNCVFVNNSSNNGGALLSGSSSGTLIECRFDGNNADAAGGAIFFEQSTMTIKNTRFVNNFSNRGGALYANQSNDTFINCAFLGNTSNEWGGAVLLYIADPSFVNCTFSGNADVAGNDGIVFMQSYATFDNTILRDEISQILEIGKPGSTIYFDPSDPVFSYSNVYQSGGSGAWALPFGTDGGNNIDEVPLFVGAGPDPLDLQATSPCIDAGDNDSIPVGVTTDILGDARIQNGIVDMGAYEQ